jgi:recombination protein RecT
MNQPAEYRSAVPQQNAQSTAFALLKTMTPEIERALPKGMDADRIARLVMTEIRKNPKLAECTQASFSGSLLNASALGLEPGINGECYLVPYKNSKNRGALECQLIIGYQGVVKLFWQHPRAQGVRTETVYENDTINEYTKGTGGRFSYTPTFGERGKIIAYYAEVRVAGVAEPLWDVFSPQQIKDLRRGKVGGNGDIPDPEHWMERKTALKQVLKLAPKTTRLDMAVRLDDAAISGAPQQRIDLTALEPAAAAPNYIEGEVESTPIEPPDDIVFASTEQLAKLGKIRTAENHDPASWADFLKNSLGASVTDDSMLTIEQAGQIIGMFTDVK